MIFFTPVKEDIKMANRYIRRCSMSLMIRKDKSKSQWDIFSHPVRMAIIKISKHLLVRMSRNWNSCELLCDNIKLCSHYGKSRFFKKLKIELLNGRTIPFLVIYPPKLTIESQWDIDTFMFITELFTVSKMWKKAKVHGCMPK